MFQLWKFSDLFCRHKKYDLKWLGGLMTSENTHDNVFECPNCKKIINGTTWKEIKNWDTEDKIVSEI